jgi:hypothetical protein
MSCSYCLRAASASTADAEMRKMGSDTQGRDDAVFDALAHGLVV